MAKPINKAKKFRFHLLAEWIINKYNPCKVADIGGGKGLLAYILAQKAFESVVIDPCYQTLPTKFKDLNKTKTKIDADKLESIPRISKPFEEEMAKDFDLLIGLHAHGSNLKIINSAKKYDKNFILLPCCVVDEPIEIKPNINWFDSIVDYAEDKGFKIKIDQIAFKGQNKIIYNIA